MVDLATFPLAKLERDITRGTWAMREDAALEGLRRLREVLRLAHAATQPDATDEHLEALRAYLAALPRNDSADDTADFHERLTDAIR